MKQQGALKKHTCTFSVHIYSHSVIEENEKAMQLISQIHHVHLIYHQNLTNLNHNQSFFWGHHERTWKIYDHMRCHNQQGGRVEDYLNRQQKGHESIFYIYGL